MRTPTHPPSRLPLPITALLAAVIAGGAIAGAQQAAPGVPFAQAVKVSVVASKPAKVGGGDWDDKTQKIVLRVKLSNADVKQSYESCTATLSIFGQSVVDGKVRKVLQQEQWPVALTSGQTLEHACDEVTTQFDKTGAKFGFFYAGWAMVVKDAQDKVVLVKATSTPWEKLPDLVAKLELNGCYNAKLQPVKAPAAYSYR